MSDLDYLEEERKKIWKKIIELEEAIDKKTLDHEKEAKQHSKKASEFKNRSEEAKNNALINAQEIENKLLEATNTIEQVRQQQKEINELKNLCTTDTESIKNSTLSNQESISSIQAQVKNLEGILSQHPNFDDELVALENTFENGKEINIKIGSLHKALMDKKEEIDELYFDIMGYTYIEEGSNKEIRVEGVKNKLEKTYNELNAKISQYSNTITEFKTQKENEISDNISKWEKEFNNLTNKIKGLLPDALTAGLSAAYSSKKDVEAGEIMKHRKNFFWAIFALACSSVIPFLLDLGLWLRGKDIESLILDMPRLATAILPLYIPLLWLAYTANKNIKLSKRLVEEYTHKEVLSKTFEGLSRQISEISDPNISSELRIKLIYNILEVSSQNPGKLITDYNKADHPLLDAVEKSINLANAVEKLAGIPGLSRISKLLEKRAQKILDDETRKAETGIDSIKTGQTEN